MKESANVINLKKLINRDRLTSQRVADKNYMGEKKRYYSMYQTVNCYEYYVICLDMFMFVIFASFLNKMDDLL